MAFGIMTLVATPQNPDIKGGWVRRDNGKIITFKSEAKARGYAEKLTAANREPGVTYFPLNRPR